MAKAIIFDMDGVIVDSERHWHKAEEKYLSKILPEWNEEIRKETLGRSIDDMYMILTTKYNLTLERDIFMTEISKIAKVVYMQESNLLPDVKKAIQQFKEQGLKLAIASSSPRAWINMVTRRFEIEHFFDQIISAQEIDGPGKPAPDIYLYAAEKLNTDPKECIVIEDSTNGVNAAIAAGMYCIAIRTEDNLDLDLSNASCELKSFQEIIGHINNSTNQ